MNTKVWYLPYFEGVYHARMIETFSNVNARMVRMVHTMITSILGCEMFECLICILGSRTILCITKLCKHRCFLQYYRYFLER